jgi:hypothetical protein
MSAMHKEMQQGTGRDKQIRQRTEEMRAMLRNQKKQYNEAKAPEGDAGCH